VNDVKILIASHNEHKIREFKEIFMDTQVKLISLKELDDHDDVEETEHTFLKNAIIKAKYYAKKYRMPAISDDSGLSVEALDGRPGVYSKRYANGNDRDNNLKLLKELEHIDDRRAYFTSVVVIYFPDCTYKAYEGIAHGTIGHTLKSCDDAFGYDPLFYPDGYDKNYADIGAKLKNQISHRARALQKLKEDLGEIINHE
jgi:XTP/dITP diphosphohydrolase